MDLSRAVWRKSTKSQATACVELVEDLTAALAEFEAVASALEAAATAQPDAAPVTDD